MLFRALLAFIALPGVIAFLAPLLIAFLSSSTLRFGLVGATVLAVGVIALLWCVREFFVTGKGTLAPWAPPRHLVTSGLYRYTRNPMYVAVLIVLVGWAIVFRSAELAVYAGAVAVAFHLRIVLGEEPWLAQTHGAEWSAYQRAVPRWLGRRPCQRSARNDDD